LLLLLPVALPAQNPARHHLRDWQIESSCKVADKGDVISTTSFNPKDWTPAKVPSTVVAAQIAAHKFDDAFAGDKDPYFGTNLRKLPGMNYRVGANFANLPMPEDSPYRCSWWYRTEFSSPSATRAESPASTQSNGVILSEASAQAGALSKDPYLIRSVAQAGASPGVGPRSPSTGPRPPAPESQKQSDRYFWLHFAGINYRANVWLNGHPIADAAHMAGMWREWEYNVTRELKPGANVLAVEVFAQKEDDLGITFVDWNPMPPDKDMGLWRPVWIDETGPVRLRNAFITTKLSEDGRSANVIANVELENAAPQPMRPGLSLQVRPSTTDDPLAFILEKQEHEGGLFAALQSGEVRTFNYSSHFVSIAGAKLWWPYGMGPQPIYDAQISALAAAANCVGKCVQSSDGATVHFAIRSVTSDLTPEGYRQFKINGRPFLIRGGGWTPDLLLREKSKEQLEAEFAYVRDMGLNTVRLEGKLETDDFFDLADRMGIMVMAGWCCCDHWEHWNKWKPEDHEISAASLADQVRRLRNHPSLLMWLNGSDGPPPPQVEQRYLEVLKQYGWPNPVISSATARATTVTGKSGVKMTGPYDYVPPDYWLLDPLQSGKKYGGAYGFNTETSPGPAIPPAQCVRRMIPADHLWPPDDVWNFHAGGGRFAQLNVYNAALTNRYGAPQSLADYDLKSQAAAYEGERAMFEAYTRNRISAGAGNATGVIQWMLNNAWPSLIWHLYDYYLVPAGGYFGTKKANEPLHAMYSYDDRSITVSNLAPPNCRDGACPVSGLKLRVRILNFDMTEKFAREVPLDAPADSVQKVLTLPEIAGLSPTHFLDLRLTDAHNQELSRNFYWLSTRPDTLDWAKSNGFTTPETQFADFSQLQSLSKVRLEVTGGMDGKSGNVTLKNPTRNLAFMIRLRATNGPQGDDIVPAMWSDNYFSLLPGESRSVTVGLSSTVKAKPTLQVEGWNVEPVVGAK